MKKFMIGLFMIAFAISFVACQETGEELVEFETEDQVFTLQALSAANLLDYSSVDQISYVPLSDTTETTTEEDTSGTEVITEEIDEVDQYLELMETYLGDNEGLSITPLESDKEGYEFLVSFTTVDLLGNEVVYYLYYNETLYEDDTDDTTTTTEVTTEETTTEAETTTEEVTTEAETTEAVTTEEATTEPLANRSQDFNFQDEDDDNVVYLLTGLIVQGDMEYNVEGKRVVEEDGSEILRLRSFIDRDNFVKVAYKIDEEDGNRKFFYEVVTDGVLVSKARVHVVEEDGALRVHLSMADENVIAKYDFAVIEEEGVTLIHIRYDVREDGVRETGNIHIEATLDEETGEVVYTYKILESQQNGNGPKYQAEIEKRHRGNSDQHRPDNNGQGNM